MSIYCGNNELHPKLKKHSWIGGTQPIVFGTHEQCQKKGYGLAMAAPIDNTDSFIAEWGGEYKPHIVQQIAYSDAALLPGYQRATLNQSLARGFALGSVAKAKKLKKEIANA